ncbi:MAG: hypothetical protein WA709_37400 [Stellaceae bacterium]
MTIATLGTPQDVTLEELRIESFFPMHDAWVIVAIGRRAGNVLQSRSPVLRCVACGARVLPL